MFLEDIRVFLITQPFNSQDLWRCLRVEESYSSGREEFRNNPTGHQGID